jgi:Tfp pilus assembly PilM family ATPase
MSLLSSFGRGTLPPVAVELAGDRVSAAAVEMHGGRATIVAHATEPLGNGVIVPSLAGPNIPDRASVIGALGRVFDRIGGRPRRVGLVVPDLAAKVSLVRFEQVPSKRADLDQLVRWQVRKTAPFPIEEAQVSYVAAARSPEGQEFIVSVAKRDVIEEYEHVCEEVGAHPGLVDLATFNLVNVVLAGSPASLSDWLLVHVAAGYVTIAILRGGQLIFFRNRASDADATAADLVHQTTMYYEDRLKGAGFERVVLVGAARSPQDGEVATLQSSLESRLASPIETVDPRLAARLTDRISAQPALLETLAPLVGLLVRGEEAA